jgi:hypothetical protein
LRFKQTKSTPNPYDLNTQLRFGCNLNGGGGVVAAAQFLEVKDVQVEYLGQDGDAGVSTALPSEYAPCGWNVAFPFAKDCTFTPSATVNGNIFGIVTNRVTKSTANYTTNNPAGDMVLLIMDSFGTNNYDWPSLLARNDYNSNNNPLFPYGLVITANSGFSLQTSGSVDIDTYANLQNLCVPYASNVSTLEFNYASIDTNASRPLVVGIPMGVNDFGPSPINGLNWTVGNEPAITSYLQGVFIRAYANVYTRTGAKRVVVATIPPFAAYTTWGGAAAIGSVTSEMASRLNVRTAMNTWIRSLSGSYPWIQVADQCSIIEDPARPGYYVGAGTGTSYTTDNLHPNAAYGAPALRPFWSDALSSAVARANSGGSSSGGLLQTMLKPIL